MFGFSPQMMGGKPKAAPFSLSGSWEASFEGWSPSNISRVSGTARTGLRKLEGDSPSPVSVDYLLSKASVTGLAITASVYLYRHSSAVIVKIQYKLGSDGSFVDVLSAATGGEGYWELIQGSFTPAAGQDVYVRFYASTWAANFDDWSISGTPL